MWKWLRFGGGLSLGEGIYYYGDPVYLGYTLSGSMFFVLQPNDKYTQSFQFYHEDFHRSFDDEFIYDINIFNARTTYQFNKYFFIRAIIQYNSYQEKFLTDFLASFTFVPGTVLHLGYGSIYDRREWKNNQWNKGRGNLIEMKRGFFFKASYLWRY